MLLQPFRGSRVRTDHVEGARMKQAQSRLSSIVVAALLAMIVCSLSIKSARAFCVWNGN